MSENLMQRFHEAQPTISLTVSDATAALDIYEGEFVNGIKQIVTYKRIGDVGDIHQVGLEMRDQYQPGVDKFEGTAVDAFWFNSEIESLKSLGKYHSALLKTAGYNLQVAQTHSTKDGSLHKWTSYSFPSYDRMNAFLEHVSPGEGIRFRDYAGGLYDGLIYTNGMRHRATSVLPIASGELFYLVHEHAALHVLGSAALSDANLEPITELVQHTRKLHDTGNELVSVSGEPMPVLRPDGTPYTPRQVISSLTEKLDNFTADIGTALFYDFENDGMIFQIFDVLFEQSDHADDPLEDPPIKDLLLPTPSPETIQQHVISVLSRVQAIDDLCRQQRGGPDEFVYHDDTNP